MARNCDNLAIIANEYGEKCNEMAEHSENSLEKLLRDNP